jgi:NTP pyrophosphatase (non-canonical NTP hydrolase)
MKLKTIVKEKQMSKFSLTEAEINALRSIQSKLHGQATDMGWHRKPREVGTLIALMHSELSEALEGARKNLMDDHLPNRQMVEVEFADCIIRILDAAGLLGLDIGAAVSEKHDYNAVREDHQIQHREAEGGKKF